MQVVIRIVQYSGHGHSLLFNNEVKHAWTSHIRLMDGWRAIPGNLCSWKSLLFNIQVICIAGKEILLLI